MNLRIEFESCPIWGQCHFQKATARKFRSGLHGTRYEFPDTTVMRQTPLCK